MVQTSTNPYPLDGPPHNDGADPLGSRRGDHSGLGTSPAPSPSHRITVSPSQVPIPPDLEPPLLEALLQGDLSPSAIARAHSLPLPDFLDWLASPTTRSRLAAAVEAEESALQLRHAAAKKKAIAELESQISTSEDPVERRRAASSLMRPLVRRLTLPTLRAPKERDPAQAVLRLPPPPEPELKHLPHDAVRIVLQRLALNDNPKPNSGLATYFNFTSWRTRQARGHASAEDFINDPGDAARLINCATPVLETLVYNVGEAHFCNQIALVRADLIDAQGKPLTADFHLKFLELGESSKWQITKLELHDPDEDEDDDDEDEDENNNDKNDPAPDNDLDATIREEEARLSTLPDSTPEPFNAVTPCPPEPILQSPTPPVPPSPSPPVSPPPPPPQSKTPDPKPKNPFHLPPILNPFGPNYYIDPRTRKRPDTS